jgi:hypothetical protein
LRDRHARATQALHQVQPADMLGREDATPARIAAHARDQPLRLIPANGVHAAARAFGECADAKRRFVHAMHREELDDLESALGQDAFSSGSLYDVPVGGYSFIDYLAMLSPA